MIDGESKGNRFGKSVDAAATVPDDRLRVDEENFCRLIAQGNTASKAADLVGWPKVSRQALSKRAKKLAWRINALRAEMELAAAVQRREVSARWVVSELRQIAMDNKAENPSVSVKALHLLGLELGMFAQRKILEKKGAKSVSDYSDEELQAIIDGRYSDDGHAGDGGSGDSEPEEGPEESASLH